MAEERLANSEIAWVEEKKIREYLLNLEDPDVKVWSLKIGGRQFVLLPKQDFERMAGQFRERWEDEYCTQPALGAEAKSRATSECPSAGNKNVTPRRVSAR